MIKEEYEFIYKKINKFKPLYQYKNFNDILLRHDVDHSIDFAFILSSLEKKINIRSTYFFLHNVNYFYHDDFFEKVRAIQENGHEIGLHLDLLSDWFKNKNFNIEENLKKILSKFKSEKINIRGISSHGNKVCYEKKFINSWLFNECKYNNQIRNAEDIITKQKAYSIPLPKNNYLTNSFNDKFKLWSISLNKYNLYYANNLETKNYITNTGGNFLRSDIDISNLKKSAQINLHPEYMISFNLKSLCDKCEYFDLESLKKISKNNLEIIQEINKKKIYKDYYINICSSDRNYNLINIKYEIESCPLKDNYYSVYIFEVENNVVKKKYPLLNKTKLTKSENFVLKLEKKSKMQYQILVKNYNGNININSFLILKYL
jgi:hypothetical protein